MILQLHITQSKSNFVIHITIAFVHHIPSSCVYHFNTPRSESYQLFKCRGIQHEETKMYPNTLALTSILILTSSIKKLMSILNLTLTSSMKKSKSIPTLTRSPSITWKQDLIQFEVVGKINFCTLAGDRQNITVA